MVGITRPITKHNFLVKSVEELGIIKKAFHIASTGRSPAGKLVDIPADISRSVHEDYKYPDSVKIRSYKPNLVGNLRQINGQQRLLRLLVSQ